MCSYIPHHESLLKTFVVQDKNIMDFEAANFREANFLMKQGLTLESYFFTFLCNTFTANPAMTSAANTTKIPILKDITRPRA